MTHEQITNSGGMQVIVWNPKSNSFQRDFDAEMWFTSDGYRRIWSASL